MKGQPLLPKEHAIALGKQQRIRDRKLAAVHVLPADAPAILGRTVVINITGREYTMTPEEAELIGQRLLAAAEHVRKREA